MAGLTSKQRGLLRSAQSQFEKAEKGRIGKFRQPKTVEIDHGFKRIIRELRKLEKKPFVKIGFPAESSKKDAKKQFMIRSPEGEKLFIDESNFVTILDVAIFSEFGTVHMPERSFMRASFDENKNKYINLNKKLLVQIYSGKINVNKALDILGFTIENDIKKFLTSGKVSPKSLRAIAEGGNTLIDTAQMINSITFVKVMNGLK